jgi:hypothetical protein
MIVVLKFRYLFFSNIFMKHWLILKMFLAKGRSALAILAGAKDQEATKQIEKRKVDQMGGWICSSTIITKKA